MGGPGPPVLRRLLRDRPSKARTGPANPVQAPADHAHPGTNLRKGEVRTLPSEKVDAAIHEVARLAILAASPINPPDDLDPAVYAQLANAWAIVALAQAITANADRNSAN